MLLALAVLLTLGVWQLRRLQWKQALLAEIEAAQGASAIPLARALEAVSRGQATGRRRVVGNCPGLEGAAILELHAIEGGAPGRRWISPCRLGEGPYAAILVDRGFVPEGAVPSPARADGAARPVVGYLREQGKGSRFSPAPSADAEGAIVWYRRDAKAMGAALGSRGRVAPVFLMLESPPPVGGLPRPAPLPTRISNNHLGYAITWFGLAAALLGVYAAMLRRPKPIPGAASEPAA